MTVQAIHATNGLDHSIVIVANINQAKFPSTGGSRDRIRYDDPIGLRQSKIYAEAHGKPHLYDNWRYKILQKCLSGEYDEERRLMYVAMSRAKHHLLFAAGDNPSPFFDNLPLEPTAIEPDVEEFSPSDTVQTRLQVSMPTIDAPEAYSAHDLMDISPSEVESREAGRGPEFGTDVHDFAEAYIEDKSVTADNDDKEHLVDFIDSLPGKLQTEVEVYLPMKRDGRQVTISGTIDLLHITRDSVDVVDYKTILDRSAEPDYQKQLSIYYHVVKEAYPSESVDLGVYYTADDELVSVEPLTQEEIFPS